MKTSSKFRYTILLFLASCLSGCFFQDEPRPDYYIKESDKITSSDLAPYSSPPCMLPINTMECSYLNLNFEITNVKKFGKDSIIAWEANNPDNKVVINFERILDQDGVYDIWDRNDNLTLKSVSVKLKGNKFGINPLENKLNSGKVYFKETDSNYDLVICGASFDYSLNTKNYKGSLSAHFVVPK